MDRFVLCHSACGKMVRKKNFVLNRKYVCDHLQGSIMLQRALLENVFEPEKDITMAQVQTVMEMLYHRPSALTEELRKSIRERLTEFGKFNVWEMPTFFIMPYLVLYGYLLFQDIEGRR